MKPILLDFEYFSKGKVKTNTAILKVIPPDGNIEAVIESIGFKEPIHNISYAQLLDLTHQIENKIIDQSQIDADNERGLVVSKQIPGLVTSKKGITGFRSFVENMAMSLEKSGKFSDEEKKDVSDTFNLINKLLGPKK